MRLAPVGHAIDIASPVEGERLRLSAGERVLRLERLRFAGGNTRTFERSVLPSDRLVGVRIDQAQHLTLAEIAEQSGLELGRATERLSIVHPPAAIALRLAANPTQQLLHLDRLTTTVDDVPIEWRIVYAMEISS
jgi:GntR family transcriptional regulator